MTPTSRSLGGHGFSDRSLRMSITFSRILESLSVSKVEGLLTLRCSPSEECVRSRSQLARCLISGIHGSFDAMVRELFCNLYS